MHSPSQPIDRDRRTIELLIAGDPAGLRCLLEDHGGVVRAYLLRKLGGLFEPWQIDEILGLAAVRMWQWAPRFDEERGRLRAWFAVVARNNALKLLAHRDGGELAPIDCVDPSLLGLATSFAEAERLRLIVDAHRCIARLAGLARSVLLADLNAADSLSSAVLADRLGTTAAAVDGARVAGRRALRGLLQQLGHRPEVVPLLPINSSAPEADA